MKKKTIKIILLILGAIVVWFFIGHYINIEYQERIKSKKKMYCYQQYWNVVNPVLFVEKRQFIDSLITYYRRIENGDTNPSFNFPPLSLPYDTCVYVIGYDYDSLVAKVVCYYNWGKQGNFIKGYVYANTLHDVPPADTMIKRE